MDKIAIIGNGFSQELYEPGDQWRLVVGCNFPRVKVDVSAFADGRAARLLRIRAPHHSRLGEFQLVLGARAAKTLTKCRNAPGGPMTCLDWLKEVGVVEDVLDYGDYLVSEQRNFTSGHLAFLWAVTKALPEGSPLELHMFGFDFLLYQPHGASTSLWDVPLIANYNQTDIRKRLTDPTEVGWADQWFRLLADCKYPQVVLHSYLGEDNHRLKGVPNVRLHQHAARRPDRPPG